MTAGGCGNDGSLARRPCRGGLRGGGGVRVMREERGGGGKLTGVTRKHMLGPAPVRRVEAPALREHEDAGAGQERSRAG